MSPRAASLALALLPIWLASACATLPAGTTPAATADPAPTHAGATPPLAAPHGQAETLTLRMGQPARLGDGGQLTYTQLIDDSRCPPGVQCAWEGSAEIALRWQPARGGARDLRLHTNPRSGPTSATLGDRTLVLVALERGITPKATLELRATP
jgi:hypothetical protein